ncbi:MAG: preprotein translocase subunit SecG [Candidatus Gastranaerophilaceae bacterium]
MLLTLIWIIQILSALLLLILVLLHSPKGDGLAAIGGMANLFSSQKSAETGLNKLTAIVAVVFIITSLITGFRGVNLYTFIVIGLMAVIAVLFVHFSRK